MDKIPVELWIDPPRQDTPDHRRLRTPTWNQAIKKMLIEGWERRWTAYLQAIPEDRIKTPA